ncbi:MAG: hypothetical protein KAV82_15575 [Phycisphaerae bacterium]|nr:hypothetical protein [Phycisphaerae bacterium]
MRTITNTLALAGLACVCYNTVACAGQPQRTAPWAEALSVTTDEETGIVSIMMPDERLLHVDGFDFWVASSDGEVVIWGVLESEENAIPQIITALRLVQGHGELASSVTRSTFMRTADMRPQVLNRNSSLVVSQDITPGAVLGKPNFPSSDVEAGAIAQPGVSLYWYSVSQTENTPNISPRIESVCAQNNVWWEGCVDCQVDSKGDITCGDPYENGWSQAVICWGETTAIVGPQEPDSDNDGGNCITVSVGVRTCCAGGIRGINIGQVCFGWTYNTVTICSGDGAAE